MKRETMTISVMPNLYTSDIEQSLRFYRDLLGGTQTFQHPSEGIAEHAELRLGDAIIALSSYEGVENEGMPSPTSGHPLELVVECESTDELVASLCADGVPLLMKPYDHFSGHRRAYVADPDANWIVIASKG
jgi:lactoylglutathione lyase